MKLHYLLNSNSKLPPSRAIVRAPKYTAAFYKVLYITAQENLEYLLTGKTDLVIVDYSRNEIPVAKKASRYKYKRSPVGKIPKVGRGAHNIRTD